MSTQNSYVEELSPSEVDCVWRQDAGLGGMGLASLGLHCCLEAFSSCSQQGLISSCAAQAAGCGGFSCGGAQALGTQVLLSCPLTSGILVHGPGIKPVSLASAGRFLTAGPPGKFRESV